MKLAGLYLERRSQTEIHAGFKDVWHSDARPEDYLPLCAAPGLSIAETLATYWETEPCKALADIVWEPFCWDGRRIAWGILADWQTQELLICGMGALFYLPPSVMTRYGLVVLRAHGWADWEIRPVRNLQDFAEHLGLPVPSKNTSGPLLTPWPLLETYPYVSLNESTQGEGYVLVSLHSQNRWHHRLYQDRYGKREASPELLLMRLLSNGLELAQWPAEASAELPHEGHLWASLVIDADTLTLKAFSEFPFHFVYPKTYPNGLQKGEDFADLWPGWRWVKLPNYQAHLAHFLNPSEQQALLMHPLALQRWFWSYCDEEKRYAHSSEDFKEYSLNFYFCGLLAHAKALKPLPAGTPSCFNPDPATLHPDHHPTIPAPWLFVFDLLYGYPDWLSAELAPWRQRDFQANWASFSRQAPLPHLVFQALDIICASDESEPKRVVSPIFLEPVLRTSLHMIEKRDKPLLLELLRNKQIGPRLKELL